MTREIVDNVGNAYLLHCFSKDNVFNYYKFFRVDDKKLFRKIVITKSNYKKLHKSYFKKYVERTANFHCLNAFSRETMYLKLVENYHRKKKLEKLLS